MVYFLTIKYDPFWNDKTTTFCQKNFRINKNRSFFGVYFGQLSRLEVDCPSRKSDIKKNFFLVRNIQSN